MGDQNENEEKSYCQISPGGYEIWQTKSGKYHRIGELPAIIFANGDTAYYENGLMHRLGGLPARMVDGDMQWCEYGRPHRLGGLPATCFINGEKRWY